MAKYHSKHSKAQKVITYIAKYMSRKFPASINTSTQTAGG
jgi:hypothetical protein